MISTKLDISLTNIWRSWYLFRRGKRSCKELEHFSYYLEQNLFKLWQDLNNSNYQHGGYREFIVFENKKRKICVAQIRDRVVHRLLYEYLVPVYDKTFIYDVWSCRCDKGLLGAIERSQEFLRMQPNSFVWRVDIKKFFDNVDQKLLKKFIFRLIDCSNAREIINQIIDSYGSSSWCHSEFISESQITEIPKQVRDDKSREGKNPPESDKIGLPIGNLTSQIFANIYLNELDRFVKHTLRVKQYLRYGDDFIILDKDLAKLEEIRENTIRFIENSLHLKINSKNDIIIKAKFGIKFLGVKIYPNRRCLNTRNLKRIESRLNLNNASSYFGLIKQHSQNKLNEFSWRILEKLYDE